jgi:hypothetical protein
MNLEDVTLTEWVAIAVLTLTLIAGDWLITTLVR